MTDQLQSFPQEDRRDVITWRNDSGQTIPAFAVVQATAFDSVNLVYSVDQPSAVGDLFFANGPEDITAGRYGESKPWEQGPAVLIEQGASTPSSQVGPIAGSWKLGHGTRFQMVTSVFSSGLAGVRPAAASNRRRAMMLGTLSPTASVIGVPPPTANAALLYTTGAGVLDYERLSNSSIRTVQVVNFLTGIAIEAGTYVRIEELHGFWEPYVADCPSEPEDQPDP